MQDALLAVLGPRMGESLQAAQNPARQSNGNPMRVPANTYRAADGKYIAIIVQNDNHWPNFCKAINRSDLLDNNEYKTMVGRVKHRETLDRLVSDEFMKMDSATWEKVLHENRIPYALVNSYIDALKDEQVTHRGVVREVEHPISGKIRVVGPPWVVAGTKLNPTAPPLLGQHTNEVLLDWLGCGSERLS
jgi:crotonobetainyl-CoA:carnitine CoA-transferase CaiB-like acyl-CoA transferase